MHILDEHLIKPLLFVTLWILEVIVLLCSQFHLLLIFLFCLLRILYIVKCNLFVFPHEVIENPKLVRHHDNEESNHGHQHFNRWHIDNYHVVKIQHDA